MRHLHLTLLLFASQSSLPTAQAQRQLTPREAVSIALENHPSVHAREYQLQARQKLKQTSFDWGKTNLSLMRGQYNSLNTDNNFGITQTIPFPTVSVSVAKLNRAEAASAEQELHITEVELAYLVRQSYLRLQHLSAHRKLLLSQDTLYENFTRAAALRFKTGESNLLEKATAETQWMENKNQLQLNEREAAVETIQLQTLLHTNEPIVPSESFAPMSPAVEWAVAGLQVNPKLNFWKFQTEATLAARQMERHRFLPELTIGYFNQSLIGFQRTGSSETFFDGDKRFTGWVFGISLPLWFLPQAGRAQASSLQHAATKKNYEGVARQLEGEYAQAIKAFEKNQANLNYYLHEASANARMILDQAQRAYKAGEIGYLEYLQALRNSYSIKTNHLQAVYDYNLALLRVEFLLGQK